MAQNPIHTNFYAFTPHTLQEKNKNHRTLPVKSTCCSFSHRQSKEFFQQPTIPPGFRRKTQRMFPVMTMFPCGDLDVLLGVECWSEACRRRESRATFGEEPNGVAANPWLLRQSAPGGTLRPRDPDRPTERADAGTCGRGEKRLPLSNRHPERRADSLSGLCVPTAGNSRPDSQSSPPPSTKEKGLTPNRFRIGVLRRKLPACTTRSLSPNGSNGERLRGMSRRLSVDDAKSGDHNMARRGPPRRFTTAKPAEQ